MKLKVHTIEGKVVGEQELNAQVFDGKVNMDLLHQVIRGYQTLKNSMRKASTKTRGDVSGSGAKPWRQKGTGRARVGEKRNPIWRKGGIVFGPHPHIKSFSLPKKIRLAALKSALNAKTRDNQLLVLDVLSMKNIETKEFAKIIRNLKVTTTGLWVDKAFSRQITLSARNIPMVLLKRADDVNAYDLLNNSFLVITQEALTILEKKILERNS